jgi:hypothetical protein
MSNTNTTRLGNTDIVNIAKQRFEKQQRSKLPSIIVNLPSSGVIYPEKHPLASGQVEMRYMTAYDEDILTNISYLREGVVFEKLLESLVITDVDINEIADVDREALILNARISSYGAEYPVSVTNTDTGENIKTVVDLKKLQIKPFNLLPDSNGEFEYKTSNATIKFTYAVSQEKSNTISEFLASYIREVNSNRSKEAIAEFIRYEFLAKDSKEFRKYLIDNAPGIDYNYEFEDGKGGVFTAQFQFGSDFFWI